MTDRTRDTDPGDHDHQRSDESCVWCCGCGVHPIGKPWGWNYRRWNRHWLRAHDRERVPVDRSTSSAVRDTDLDNWRNRLAGWLANWVLRTIATPEYRAWIDGAIRYGLRAAARDAHQETPTSEVDSGT